MSAREAGAKPTPGPWRYAETLGPSPFAPAEMYCQVLDDAAQEVVCEAMQAQHGPLLAEAPAMLAALREALECIADQRDPTPAQMAKWSAILALIDGVADA